MVALATEGLPVFETKCEFPQGLKRVCENCAVPEGTRYFFPLYPGLTPPNTRKGGARWGPGTPWANEMGVPPALPGRHAKFDRYGSPSKKLQTRGPKTHTNKKNTR